MIDLNSSCAIIDAAMPFDKSYTKGRTVMLAGQELVGFVRHMVDDACGSRHVPGRRKSDCVKADRIAELEAECARLQAANDMLTALRERDRRQRQEPFNHPDFRRG